MLATLTSQASRAPLDGLITDRDHLAMHGARFFDVKNSDRGWAENVTRRAQRSGRLTILDVVCTEPALTSFLARLDRGVLNVQCADASGTLFKFAWASGYRNGNQIRIQGVLAS